MSAHIGSVQLAYPLRWINKDEPVVLGSETRTRDGNLVVLRPETSSQRYRKARLVFEWTPWASVRTFMNMWRSGDEFEMDPEGTGESHRIRFASQAGVTGVKHQIWGDDVVKAHADGGPVDLYTGELNVIITG
ncbi:MAG: hypothetical protein V2B18_02085 [Pseudomonadota bacterium]